MELRVNTTMPPPLMRLPLSGLLPNDRGAAWDLVQFKAHRVSWHDASRICRYNVRP